MDASLGLKPAKLDPAGAFRAREMVHFSLSKCDSFVGTENQRGRTLPAKMKVLWAGGAFCA
jgi:hypothetical protein